MSTSVRILLAAVLFAVGAMVLVMAAAWTMAPRGVATQRPAVTVAPASAVLVMGEGAASANGLRLDRFSPVGEAFVVWQLDPLTASELPVLRYRIEGLPLNHVLMLAWRTADGEEAHYVRLQTPDGTLQHELLARYPAWRGEIVELALYMYPHPQTTAPAPFNGAVTVRHLSLQPDTLWHRLRVLASHWLAADPWNMMAISSLGIYSDLSEPVRLLPVVAALSALAWLAWSLATGSRTLRDWVGRGLVVALVATLALQLLSLRNLALQRAATAAVFGELPQKEWSTQLFDAPLVAMIDQVRQQLPPPGRARIFTASDDRFFRLRMAWHLRPHNVLSGLPGADLRGRSAVRFIRPGDYIVAWRRADLVQQAERGRVAIAGQQVAVRLLFRQDDGGLFEVMPPRGGEQ